uniref:Histidine kinase domain-containing protein n=1 Tax=Chromera velia CCMP2878 TaxID=1169474 RepID=A0A0G4GHF7_9ALVE|eukprot:Cvel_21881.t1-p1 / transcript=Cvel_21881.t1 / gene=Cvel_21881 / organism=Chromera_velia_CCMP2878 / gene_product=hypothetical protein / transcript_product=hypothetical protein / location=Cvel_scaffold2092:15349-22146(-) / protein_length=275 / sequence_SO=supercontig / SO=protein_coding / is_pseudo=false
MARDGRRRHTSSIKCLVILNERRETSSFSGKVVGKPRSWVSSRRCLFWFSVLLQLFQRSYMIHEMRNPIGGAMFLLDDLEHTTRSWQAATRRHIQAQRPESPSLRSMFIEKRGFMSGRAGMETESEFDFPLAAQAAQIDFLEKKIRTSLESMKSVCDDVLTLKKAHKRGFEYLVSTTDPLAWVIELSELERLSMTAENIQFKVDTEIAPDLDQAFASKTIAAAADWLYLRQVVVNFLSNARKFTKGGGSTSLQFNIKRLVPSALPPECVLVDRNP